MLGPDLDAHRGYSLSIEQATAANAAEILALQKLAYQSEADIYRDPAIPPLTQTLEEIEADFGQTLFLKASIEGKIIGSVRAFLSQGTCHIGRLVVHPDFQNRGIGTQLMGEIEACFDQAKRYELFTGHKSARNLHLYQKLGYTVCRSQRITGGLTLVFLEKSRQREETA
jgi:ribosomal protein S18 acetylase RimI-like enzyme